jgi:hypothetical protein
VRKRERDKYIKRAREEERRERADLRPIMIEKELSERERERKSEE